MRTALVVGTALTLVNQWEVLREGRVDLSLLRHAAFNVAVPFLVALYSRTRSARALERVGE